MKAVTTVVLALGFSGLVASIALHASQQSLGTSSAAPADAGVSGGAAAAAVASVTADDTVDAQDSDSLGTLQERIARGFEIAPVPLNLEGKRSRPCRAGELPRQRRRRVQRLPHQPALCRRARPVPGAVAKGQCVALPGGGDGVWSIRVEEPDSASERTAREPDIRAVPHRHAQGLRPERPRAVVPTRNQESAAGHAVARVQPHAPNRPEGDLRIPSRHSLAPERATILGCSRAGKPEGGGPQTCCGPHEVTVVRSIPSRRRMGSLHRRPTTGPAPGHRA